MKIALVVGLVVCSVATASLTNSSDLEEEEWTLYKSTFKKIYKYQNEEAFRRNNYFEYKLKMIKHNKLYEKGEVSYGLGINTFSDLTNDEIIAKTSCSTPWNETKMYSYYNDSVIPLMKRRHVPPLLDWRTSGCVSAVKNQGDCRACWAISAVESLESVRCVNERNLVSLSEQNLIDCVQEISCESGRRNDAFHWIKSNGGVATYESYPYESGDGWERICRKGVQKPVPITGYYTLPFGDEISLEQVLITMGPVSTSVHADGDFFGYAGGVYNGSKHGGCTGNENVVNHDVVVIGFGMEQKGLEYWIVKNSWGEGWGESGYMKILRHKNNHCGIASFTLYPGI